MLLERLALVGEALSGRLDPSEIIEIVIRQGMAALDAEGGVVCLLDAERMVTPVLTVGYPVGTLPGFGPLTLDRLLPITVAARDSVAVWVSTPEEGLERFPSIADAPTASQAWVALPLLDRGAAFGVISLTFTAPRRFGDDERAYLKALTHLTALALRDARLGRPTITLPARHLASHRHDAPVEIAVLDACGTIVETNDAWRAYGLQNDGDPDKTDVGASYLAACDDADGAPGAAEVAHAIRAALRGEPRPAELVQIPCPFPSGENAATIVVSPRTLADGRPIGATVVIIPTHS